MEQDLDLIDSIDSEGTCNMASYSNSGSSSSGVTFMAALGGFVVGAVVTWIWTQYWNLSSLGKPGGSRNDNDTEQDALLLNKGGDVDYCSQRTQTSTSSSSTSPSFKPSAATSLNKAASLSAIYSDSFLADMLSALWKQVNAVATTEIQTAVEPMFADLPSPLSTLRFTKVCLGHVPLRIENIVILDHAENNDFVQFNVDVVWDGECDIQMKADYIGSLGVRSLKLQGRLSVVLQPLVDVSPIVGAVQYAFVNTPRLELDFTGMAAVADIKSIKTTIISTILESIDAVMVLPKRSILRLLEPGSNEPAAAPSFLQIYRPPLGIVRLHLLRGRGFETEQRTLLRNDVRDVYCNILVAKHKVWKSTVASDTANPEWSANLEYADFVVYDRDEHVHISARDRDDGSLDLDDHLGEATVTLGELLEHDKDATSEIPLTIEGQPTCASVTVQCDLLPLVESLDSLRSISVSNPHRICGLLTILVSQAFDLPLSDEVTTEPVPVDTTYVNVSFGSNHEFVALAVTGGIHPTYDSEFHVPITADMMAGSSGPDKLPPIVLTLMQKTPDGTTDHQLGIVHISSSSLIASPQCTISGRRPLGDVSPKATLELLVSLRGVADGQASDSGPPMGPTAVPTLDGSAVSDDYVSVDGMEAGNGWGV